MCYSIEPRTRNRVNEHKFLLFARDFSNKHRKQLVDTREDALKNTSKKVMKETERRNM